VTEASSFERQLIPYRIAEKEPTKYLSFNSSEVTWKSMLCLLAGLSFLSHFRFTTVGFVDGALVPLVWRMELDGGLLAKVTHPFPL
jgi:hypothetical protein